MEKVYEEDFVDSRVMKNEQSITFLLDRLKEIYSQENGWVIGTPEITVNPVDNNYCIVKVHLEKYDKKNEYSK